MTLDNIRAVAGEGLFAKHTKHRREPEVNMDLSKEWCPSPTCDTILTTSFSSKVQCEKCKSTFQVINGKLYQPGETLKEVDYLRECPQCSRPIFREGGCALITCVCGKIFCWYCRKSLDNDPFLSHFKKGLCKNKLGCGRFELLRYRLMVVGIHVGIGILSLIFSPVIGPYLIIKDLRKQSNNKQSDIYLYSWFQVHHFFYIYLMHPVCTNSRIDHDRIENDC
uniref:E3 ligase n=1 Tax=Hemigrapsus takanoi nimavirus TaxID=2133792 RepID=A0A401IP61_9VIRU|nr:MAG: hypothetical protein [Hemigrapsus takanoi nimavirus]GBG35392.1 E3 ligase [Hemigrapsus takanoi nimavirus]